MAAESNTAILVFSNGKQLLYKRHAESKDTLGVMQVAVPPGYSMLHKIYVTAANLVYMDVDAGGFTHQIPKAADTGFDTGFFTLNAQVQGNVVLTVHQ